MKNFSTSIQRKKRGKRTEYIARLTYYDKTGKRKGVSISAAFHWDARSAIPLRKRNIGNKFLISRLKSLPHYCVYVLNVSHVRKRAQE
jgi:hypothetical protein